MLARLWRWLRRLWQSRFNRRYKPLPPPAAPPPLTHTDYEFLFMRVMDGLAAG